MISALRKRGGVPLSSAPQRPDRGRLDRRFHSFDLRLATSLGLNVSARFTRGGSGENQSAWTLLHRVGLPILDERDRRSVARQLRVDEEAPVGSDAVIPACLPHATADDARADDRRARLKRVHPPR